MPSRALLLPSLGLLLMLLLLLLLLMLTLKLLGLLLRCRLQRLSKLLHRLLLEWLRLPLDRRCFSP